MVVVEDVDGVEMEVVTEVVVDIVEMATTASSSMQLHASVRPVVDRSFNGERVWCLASTISWAPLTHPILVHLLCNIIITERDWLPYALLHFGNITRRA